MSQIQARQFSSYYRVLTGSGQEKLLESQKKFDQDPNNVESAFLYFRVSIFMLRYLYLGVEP